MLLEASNLPIAWARTPGVPEWADWLRGREGAVLHVPAGEGDTQAMLDGTAHWRPLINGDSGFVPRPYARLRELLDRPLDGEPLRLLRAVGAREVVSAQPQPLPVLARFDSAIVYGIPDGPAATVPDDAEPVPTLWSAEGAIVALGGLRTVGRVVFELDDRPWVDRPAVWASRDGAAWTAIDAEASLADATLALYRDPRSGRGQVRFPPTRAGWLRVDPRLPARSGLLAVAP
jgi:hypothetical protein